MGVNENLILKDEAYAIVDVAMGAHSRLGPGFLEAVYGNALALELEQGGIPFAREVPVPIAYKGTLLGHPDPADFIPQGQIILALKAIRNIGDNERTQALHYLRATWLLLALLLSFGAPKLDWARLVLTQ